MPTTATPLCQTARSHPARGRPVARRPSAGRPSRTRRPWPSCRTTSASFVVAAAANLRQLDRRHRVADFHAAQRFVPFGEHDRRHCRRRRIGPVERGPRSRPASACSIRAARRRFRRRLRRCVDSACVGCGRRIGLARDRLCLRVAAASSVAACGLAGSARRRRSVRHATRIGCDRACTGNTSRLSSTRG